MTTAELTNVCFEVKTTHLFENISVYNKVKLRKAAHTSVTGSYNEKFNYQRGRKYSGASAFELAVPLRLLAATPSVATLHCSRQ